LIDALQRDPNAAQFYDAADKLIFGSVDDNRHLQALLLPRRRESLLKYAGSAV
jgi:hypothetical protein